MELKQEIIKILPDLKEALQAGVQYGGDLFDRFVVLQLWKYGLWSATAIMFVILFLFMYCMGIKEKDIDISSAAMIFTIISILISGIGIFGLITTIYVPEITVINYFK